MEYPRNESRQNDDIEVNKQSLEDDRTGNSEEDGAKETLMGEKDFNQKGNSTNSVARFRDFVNFNRF